MECEAMEYPTADGRRSAIAIGQARLLALGLASGGKDRAYHSATRTQRRRLMLTDLETKPARVRKLVAEIILKCG